MLAFPFFLYLKGYRELPGLASWYGRLAVGVVSPFLRLSRAVQEGASRVVRRYFFLVGTERENEALRKLVEATEMRRFFLDGIARENERLAGLVEFQKRLPFQTVAARVLAYPPLSEFRLMTVDRGEESGIRRGAPVLAPQGLVGRVIRVQGNSSEVLLLTDPTSAVDARAVRTGARGLVVGKETDLRLNRRLFIGALEFWERSQEVGDGDLLVTSGLDGVFPADIPIGIVQDRKKGKYEVFQEGKVLPAVDFHKLREVLIER